MEAITELSYALDTFYFLVAGALVMWMAAGFAMLEAGLVRSKNVAMQLVKNIGLFSFAAIMYWLVGFNLNLAAEVGEAGGARDEEREAFAETASGLPILLRTSADTGHGGLPLSEQIEQIVDIHSFIFDRLGIEFRQPETEP